MQIRVANKQDEPAIRSFVDARYKTIGKTLNLDGEDSDLMNVEANYFGKEGLFVVVEEERTIVGIAGARRKSDLVLELRRLIANEDAVEEIIDVITSFAPRLLYERIDVQLVPPSQEHERILEDRGFKDETAHEQKSRTESSQNGDVGTLSLAVTPDF